MAQARVKATGDIVELAPGSKDGKFCMQDIITGKFYEWHELEKVAVKAGADKLEVSAVEIKVTPTVTGELDHEKS